MPNLVEKLAAVFKDADKVFKEGRADAGFSYLRIVDLSEALRGKLFAAGILVIPSDLDCDFRHRDSSITDRIWTEAAVRTNFTVTDGSEKLEFVAWGFARDLDGYAVATAQTAALKSFLKRLAMIFGDYDDPERFDDNKGYDLSLGEGEQKWGSDIREWPISRGEAISFNIAAKSSGITDKAKKNYLDANFGADNITSLRRKFLAQAMQWALATGEKPADAAANEA